MNNIKINHCYLVNPSFDIDDIESLSGVKYYESKFPREVGDEINDNGDCMIIGVVADSKAEATRQINALIDSRNKITKEKNKETRLANKIAKEEALRNAPPLSQRDKEIIDCLKVLACNLKYN